MEDWVGALSGGVGGGGLLRASFNGHAAGVRAAGDVTGRRGKCEGLVGAEEHQSRWEGRGGCGGRQLGREGKAPFPPCSFAAHGEGGGGLKLGWD